MFYIAVFLASKMPLFLQTLGWIAFERYVFHRAMRMNVNTIHPDVVKYDVTAGSILSLSFCLSVIVQSLACAESSMVYCNGADLQ